MSDAPDPAAITQIVAIDGPAGAGKSTTARRVAEALGFAFLDTGAMYRAATWRALERGIDLDAPEAATASTQAMRYEVRPRTSGDRILVDDTDVTDAIRTPEVTRMIHRIDNVPAVRACLVDIQRRVGALRPTVAEGRDMGTVVFPAARCKVFLDASLEERARRRHAELTAKGVSTDFDELLREVHERDERNRNRETSPLRKADDAVLVDTTHLSPAEAVATIVRLTKERL